MVGAEHLLRLKDRGGMGLELGPVDLAGLQGLEVDFGDGRVLVDQGVFSVFAPQVGGGYDQPVGEGLLARGGEEAVDVLLLKGVVRGLELALNRVELTGPGCLRDEVDASVLGPQPLDLGPICIGPYIAVEIPIGGLIAEVGQDEILEVGSLFTFRDSSLAKRRQKAGKCGHADPQ